jgi:type III secretion protein U
MSSLQLNQLWEGLHELFMPVVRSFLVLLVLVSLVDMAAQRGFFKKKMKMTNEEVKQEKKSNDGDPHIKSKRRMIAQQFLMASPAPTMDKVKNADVLVVNPTHIAIAIEYKPGQTPLPVVSYKSVDKDAVATIEFAKSHQIPVVRYLWLARTLHRTTPVGMAIPRETIQAAAAVFRVIKQLAENDPDFAVNTEGVYEIAE